MIMIAAQHAQAQQAGDPIAKIFPRPTWTPLLELFLIHPRVVHPPVVRVHPRHPSVQPPSEPGSPTSPLLKST